MLKFKKQILIVVTAITISLGAQGCVNTKAQHDGDSDQWITEQVDAGHLTEEEATALREQE